MTDRGAISDPLAAVPPPMVRVGGAAVGVAGAFAAGVGAQLLLLLPLTAGQTNLAIGVGGIGVAMVGLAPLVMKGRSWAAIAGVGLSASGAGLTTGWLGYAVAHGVVSPLMLLAAAAGALALVAAPLTVIPSVRVTAARRRLYDA